MNKITLFILLICIFILGCDGIRKIPATEFQNQYRLKNMQSMKTAEYLGQKEGRAFIRLRTMSPVTKEWTEEIVYSELTDLDKEFRSKLPENQNKAK